MFKISLFYLRFSLLDFKFILRKCETDESSWQFLYIKFLDSNPSHFLVIVTVSLIILLVPSSYDQ